ncbi:MAG: energy transducer TonB, partial [Silvibacterium sp.]
MFEDSLAESTGRIRTGSRWYAIGSFIFQVSLLAVLIVIPYLYPDSLPKQALSTLLLAPPPPASPAQETRAPAAHAASPVQLAGLTAPATIPNHIAEEGSTAATPPGMAIGLENQGTSYVPGAMSLIGSAPPHPPVVTRPKPSGPLRISSGVAEGHLLAPIQPIYPAIAKAARIQGTVVIEATVSKQGFVDHTHVVSGPVMLAQAALTAVNRARYQPYKLNGEPVEVETTIN